MRGSRADARKRRHTRLRKRLSGTPEAPRLAVFKSNRHIYAQVIDDAAGATVAAASSLEKGINGGTLTVETAAEVGKVVAGRAKDAGVTKVVFDRGGFAYHGRIKALADSAREEGLEF